MAELTVIWWRDIPAQVVAGTGRGAAKIQLSNRFQEAIDMAATRAGLIGSDDYLAHWRWSEPEERAGAPNDVLDALERELEAARG